MMKNIVLFLTDDHGQWALPAYGNRELRTPGLDWLARTGVVMENAFTPTPVCSPARACLMSGRLASQHGLHDYIATGTFDDRRWLAAEATLPELMSEAGYQVGLSGKWHLGDDMSPQPGFDFWFALSGDHPYPPRGRYRFSRQGEEEMLDGYKTEIVTDEAVRFLRQRDRDRPFFLTVGHTATHSPWDGNPPRLVESYRDATFADVPEDAAWPFGTLNLESTRFRPPTQREGLAQYYAAVSSIDEAVGRLVDELETDGCLDDTLVVYTSDHGLCCGHHGIWGKGNGTLPLNMVEESIRVPMILRRPHTATSGLRRAEPVDHLDLFQTLLDYAGVAREDEPPGGYPGASFLPLLSGGAAATPWRTEQFGEYGPVRMVRTDRYKLVTDETTGRTELFDLVADPRETHNIAGDPAATAVLDDLAGRLAAHFARYEVAGKSGFRAGGPAPTNATSPWAPSR